jgi:probable HAF family extracellular repeat protein
MLAEVWPGPREKTFMQLSFRVLALSIGASLLCTTLQAQTQASCSFHEFTLPSNGAFIINGVNDNGTVVGTAFFPNGSVPFKAFVRYANGKTVYWLPSGAVQSGFNGRNNNGVTTGAYFDASNQHHAFLLNGSTVTPISKPAGASPMGINKYNTVVGAFDPGTGLSHGFKRYSNGSIIHLDYPNAVQTFATGINDNGVIVGFDQDTNNVLHGFIYHNSTGLSYPSLCGKTARPTS